jgi:hypothetical protein
MIGQSTNQYAHHLVSCVFVLLILVLKWNRITQKTASELFWLENIVRHGQIAPALLVAEFGLFRKDSCPRLYSQQIRYPLSPSRGT